MGFTIDRPDCFLCGYPKTAHNASALWLNQEFETAVHAAASIPRRWMMECKRLMMEEARIIVRDAAQAQLELEELQRRMDDLRRWEEGLL